MTSQSCVSNSPYITTVYLTPTNEAEKSGKVAETPLVRTLTYWEEQKHQENLIRIKGCLHNYINEPKLEDFEVPGPAPPAGGWHYYERIESPYFVCKQTGCVCHVPKDTKHFIQGYEKLLEDRKIGHKWVTEHLPILENNPRLAEYVAKAKSYRGVEDRPTIYNSGVMEAFEEGKRQIENEERYLLKQKEEQEKKRIERIAEQEKAKLSAIEAEARRRIKEEEDAAKKAAEEAAILAKMAEIKAEDAFKKRMNELNGLF